MSSLRASLPFKKRDLFFASWPVALVIPFFLNSILENKINKYEFCPYKYYLNLVLYNRGFDFRLSKSKYIWLVDISPSLALESSCAFGCNEAFRSTDHLLSFSFAMF
jgi:hypothetical protein